MPFRRAPSCATPPNQSLGNITIGPGKYKSDLSPDPEKTRNRAGQAARAGKEWYPAGRPFSRSAFGRGPEPGPASSTPARGADPPRSRIAIKDGPLLEYVPLRPGRRPVALRGRFVLGSAP